MSDERRRTVWLDGRDVPVRPWDADTTGSTASLANLTRALVRNRGWFSDAYCSAAPEGRNAVLFRVWIPEGRDAAVATESGASLRLPPCISLNDSRDRFLDCEACGVRFNCRRTLDERDRERAAPDHPACSDFCAGRLVGRADGAASPGGTRA